MQRRTHGHALVGVDALKRLFAHHFLDRILHRRNTGRTAHQQHFVDLGSGQTAVFQRLLHRTHGRVDQAFGQLIELGTGQRHIQVFGAGRIGGDEGQVDVAGRAAGQLDLALFCRFAQTLHRHFIGGQIHTGLFLKAFDHPIHDLLVEIVATQAVVTGGREHFLHAVAHFDDGHIEGTAAEVVDHDLLVVFFINAVRQRRGGRLVDDTLDIQARDLARVLGRLTLGIGEVSGNGDDRFGHGVAQIRFRVLFQLLQDHRGDFLRSEILAVDGHLVVVAHFAFDGRNGALRVGDRLLLRDATDDTLAVFFERDHRGRGARAFRVGDDDGFAALDHSHTRVCRTQVNTNNLCHIDYLPNTYRSLYVSIRSDMPISLQP